MDTTLPEPSGKMGAGLITLETVRVRACRPEGGRRESGYLIVG